MRIELSVTDLHQERALRSNVNTITAAREKMGHQFSETAARRASQVLRV